MQSGTAVKIVREIRKYIKDLGGYSLLIVFPLALSIVLLLVTRETIDQQIQKNGELKVDYLVSAANTVLDEAQHTAELIANDPAILDALESGEEIHANAANISERMLYYVSGSSYIENVFIINPFNDQIINQDGYFTYASGSAIFSVVDPRLPSESKSVLSGWNVVNKDFAPPYYVAQIPSQSGEGTVGTLVVILKMSSFLHLLYTVDAELCCLFNEECEISTLILAHEAVDWRSEKDVSLLLGKSVKCVLWDDDHFTYLVALSTREYYRPVRLILTAFAVYFAMVLIYGIWQLTRILRRRDEHITSIVEMLPTGTSQGTSYEELLNSVHAALESYRDNDKSAQELLRERSMRYLLNGHQSSSYDLMAASGIRTANGYYVATLFVSDYGDIWEEDHSEEHLQIIDIIFHSAFSQFAQAAVSIASVDMYPNYAVVFSILNPDGALDAIREILINVRDFLRENFGVRLQCVVSSMSTDPKRLSQCFQETFETYGIVSAVNSDAAVITQADTELGGDLLSNSGSDYIKQLQILINTLLVQKYELLPSMVMALLNECVTPYLTRASLVQYRTDAVITVLRDSIRSSELPPEQQNHLLEKLSAARNSIPSLNEAAVEISKTFVEFQRSSGAEDLVGQACAYICEHFSDSCLSLPAVCEAVGCSVQHLSRLFRQKKDITINEYLNDQRINRAKLLLVEHDLSIHQVAAAVGYVSMDTFARNFRRREGLTPSEYRNMHR